MQTEHNPFTVSLRVLTQAEIQAEYVKQYSSRMPEKQMAHKLQHQGQHGAGAALSDN